MAERRKAAPIVVVTPPAIEPEASDVIYVPSGATMLDLVLGGGYGLGRIVNIVGDRSAGKSLLAIESIANFVEHLGEAKNAKYVDAESASVDSYVQVLGMPSGVQTHDEGMETIEEFFADFKAFLDGIPDGQPCMYILDSLDALSDAAEMERDYDKGSYGAEKAKKLSQFFRRNVTLISQKNCLLIIVSQIRDKIGVTFGETKTRSGGKALDFYASQILWLSEIGKIRRTALSVQRAVGIEVRARTKKNKIGLAFRETELTVIFNYGLDDEISMLNWLKTSKAESALPNTTFANLQLRIERARAARDRDALALVTDELRTAVRKQWGRIEDRLAPPMRKYDRGA